MITLKTSIPVEVTLSPEDADKVTKDFIKDKANCDSCLLYRACYGDDIDTLCADVWIKAITGELRGYELTPIKDKRGGKEE